MSGQPAFLDSLLTLQEAAEWFGLSVKRFSKKARGKRPVVPPIVLNRRTLRFSPRLILANAGHEAGMPPELIAAALNLKPNQQQ